MKGSRRSMQGSDKVRTGAASVSCMFALGLMLLPVQRTRAQGTPYPPMRGDQSSGSGAPSGRGSNPSNMPSTSLDLSMSPDFARETSLRRERARKEERKKRMVDNANRLLELTRQLRAELATRETVPDDARRLDEIARLARLVKDQMRD